MAKYSLPRMPLYVTILIGMAAGIAFGVLAYKLGVTQGVTNWVKPFGEVFMRLLKCIAIPLVFVSLIRGVANIGGISSLSRLGIRTIVIYLGTTLVAIMVGLAYVEIIAPGNMVGNENATAMQQAYQSTVESGESAAAAMQNVGPLQWLVDVVPDNVIGAVGSNANMLQVIFIAVMIGVAILLVGQERSKAFMNFVDSLDAIIMKIIDLIMKFAPLGVFALMAAMIVENVGNMQLISALGMYVVTVVVGLLTVTLLFYPLLIKLFTKIPISEFYKKIFPVQLLAFTTSSSAATLPLTMETVQRDFNVSNKTASFVLPVGVTINMDGTSLYQVVAAVFIAQVLGIELGWIGLLTIIATTTISSIGTPGVPGGSVVILVMVLSSVGIPAEGLALILGLDRPLDMLRTVVNVTGDATVCLLVDKK